MLAAERGFHSLVKLLLGHAVWPQRCLDAALGRSAAGGHYEVTKLLLETGASICDVAAKELVVCGNPDVVFLLVTKGVDIETGDPLAYVIENENPQALALLRHGQKRLAAIRKQGALALTRSVIHKDENRAERLYRAGCDHRLEVPIPCTYAYARSGKTLPSCAMWEAFKTGSFRLFMIMGPTRKKDLQNYLHEAWFCRFDWPKMQMLIRRGAKVNDQPNGGSKVLQTCIWYLRHSNLFGYGSEKSERILCSIKHLAEAGAKWKPDDRDFRWARYSLRELDDARAFQLAQTLFETKAAKPKLIWRFYNTPTLRRKRGAVWLKVAELLGLKVKPYNKHERNPSRNGARQRTV
ncbi:MAG: ankyrin repeat domain-containing protein [Lentisphaerae bacterium]|nr:ankyrin repeat domain-containing protein [Lentisphaerota bacterium]